VAAIGELNGKPAGELQVHGSDSLVRWLFDNQLVDEITLLTVPVVVGQGTWLFPDTGPDIALDLCHVLQVGGGGCILRAPGGPVDAGSLPPSGWLASRPSAAPRDACRDTLGSKACRCLSRPRRDGSSD
jgi:hypothetical protein